MSRIAARYAKSLFDLAVEKNELEPVLGDVNALKKALQSRDLLLLIKSPIINATKKLSIFEVLFKDKLQHTTNAFLNLMIRKGREMFLPEILNSFVEQYKEYKGITTVKLISAEPISAENLELIKSKLVDSSATAKSLDITTKVDPSLLGGFVVEIGDKLYDNSIAHKLNKLKKEFEGN